MPETSLRFGHCAKDHIWRKTQKTCTVVWIANNMTTEAGELTVKFNISLFLTRRHCQTWNRGEAHLTAQSTRMRSILQPTGLRMKERLSSYLCYMYHRHKNLEGLYPVVGEPWYRPQVGRGWPLGLIGVWSSLIWVEEKPAPSSPARHPFSQRRQGSGSYPTPSPNLPLPWPFPHFIQKSPEQMCQGKWREHCDFLHTKCTRNDQSWLVRGKLNDIQNSAENRNCSRWQT